MDIEKFRENQKKHYENNLLKRQIRKQIKDTLDEKQSRQFESKELFKPVITSQKEVKETIDKKQDKLIENLNEKQEKLISAVDMLNETMSSSGSQSGVQSWLSDLPSKFDPLDIVPEENEEEDEDEEVPKKEVVEEHIFNQGEKNIIRKYGFDPDLNDIPDEKEVRSAISHLTGKRRSSNRIIKNNARKDQEILSKYRTVIKGINFREKTGDGIRSYKQPKRNAYKINNGQYGGLLINMPRLINEMVIEAVKDGKMVYEDIADKSLVDLITKRFDPKKKYSSKAIKIFNNLNLLSNIPKHRSSGKSKLIGGAMIYSDPNDLMKRLTLLTGSKRAGNTSIVLRNEMWQIIDYLLKQDINEYISQILEVNGDLNDKGKGISLEFSSSLLKVYIELEEKISIGSQRRSSKYCKRYEYVSFDLQNPITLPANNQSQKKSGYRFVIDSSSETHPFDLYNSYLSVDFKITKMDNTGYNADDQVATVNSGYSLINQLKVELSGVNALGAPGVNHAINVKNLTELSSSYTETVGPSMFNYPDTSVGAVSEKYTMREVQHGRNDADNAYEARNVVDGDNVNYNEGFAKRKALLTASAENNIVLPLNRYGFFNSFETEIAPNGKVTIDVSLETDNNVIFRAGGDPGRFIVTRLVLWVPKMIFNAEGEQIFLQTYLKPHTWSYLKERIEISPSTTARQGTFRITSSIRKPRHVFIWALNDAKMNDQTQNPFLFNTYNIANNRTFSNARLELSNGIFYPNEELKPDTEIVQAYRTLMEYQKDFNAYYTSPTITLKSFQELYGLIYFDLRNQEEEIKSGSTKIQFIYNLSGNPNANYSLYALILHEEELSVDIVNGKVLLKA
ncbi:hypothetical protein ACROYT_G021094 [Oculina patagonica]